MVTASAAALRSRRSHAHIISSLYIYRIISAVCDSNDCGYTHKLLILLFWHTMYGLSLYEPEKRNKDKLVCKELIFCGFCPFIVTYNEWCIHRINLFLSFLLYPATRIILFKRRNCRI